MIAPRASTVNHTIPPHRPPAARRHHQPSQVAADTSRDQQHQQVVDTLQLFVGDNSIMQLVAFDVGETNQHVLAGYYDADHLRQMATDACRISGQCKGVYFTFNPIDPEIVAVCDNQLQTPASGQMATDRSILGRRFLFVDVDPTRPSGVSASDAEKSAARNRLDDVLAHLASSDWPPPIVADSGNGFHLMYRIDEPTDDGGLVKRCLQALSLRFSDDAVKIDTSVYNPSRVTRLYGTMACKGEHSPDRPHRRSQLLDTPTPLVRVPTELLERLASEVPAAATATSATAAIPVVDETNVLQRARAYVATMPPAIEGQNGSNQTFEVACRLVWGFGLSTEQAMPILQEYNLRCQPPWSDDELRRKLRGASQRDEPRGRGYLLRDSDTRIQTDSESQNVLPPVSDGVEFYGSIPDFVLLPTVSALFGLRPEDISPQRGRPKSPLNHCFGWLGLLSAVRLKRTATAIPDLLLSQCSYGAAAPTHWRASLRHPDGQRQRTIEQSCRRTHQPFECTDENCLLYGWTVPHDHYFGVIPLGNLPAFAPFAVSQSDNSYPVLDFSRCDEDGKTFQSQLIRGNRLYHAYLPILLFGQAAGCNIRQIRLIQGLVREQTRRPRGRRASHTGQDRLLYIEQATVPGVAGDQMIPCPLLDRNATYVSFGGNLRQHRGRGYAIVGLNRKGWLHRVGYPVHNASAETIRRYMEQFLKDLVWLGANDRFNLTVAALGRNGRWTSLDEMNAMVHHPTNRQWLETCRLRIFVPANYLALWRRWFATELGFYHIPGGRWCLPQQAVMERLTPRVTRQIQFRSPADVRDWLNRVSLTQKQLAEGAGWNPTDLSRRLNGHRRWSKGFRQAIEAFAAEHAERGEGFRD